MKTSAQRIPGWLFIAGWVGLSILGLLLAWAGTFLILSIIVKLVGSTIQVAGQTHITEDYLAMVILFPLVGLITGLLQFLLLRQIFPRAGRWVWATFLGWAVSFGILELLTVLNPSGWAANNLPAVTLLFSLAGLLLGLAQWLVLKTHTRQSGWWILISTLAWGLSSLFIGATISETYDYWFLLLLPALVTGLGLWLLLKKAPQRTESMAISP